MKPNNFAAAALCASFLLGVCAQDSLAAKRRVRRQPATQKTASSTALLVSGNNSFALQFFKQLDKGNLICSPYGVSEVFGMVQAGARANTAAEIADAFRFPAQAQLHRSYALLRTQVSAASLNGDLTLNIADSVWPEKSELPLPVYIKTLKKFYGAAVTPLDFIRKADASRGTINSWAEKNTQGRIKDLLPPDAVNSATRLVLVNAVYFKGLWESQFKPEATLELPFHAPAETKHAPLMYQKNSFAYAEDENAQILELPYRGRAVSMLVVLPRPDKTLAQVEEQLDTVRLEAWKAMVQKKEVKVWLPKFKTSAFYDLKDALEALGVKDAFRAEKADFSGINGTGGLYISKALQKAFVEVTEEGTEAAAASAVVFTKMAMLEPKQAEEFRADRPFLYLIRHNATGALLFIGRVEDPSK